MKRHSFFPLVLVAFTLALVTLFVFVARPVAHQVDRVDEQIDSSLSEESYKSAARTVMQTFFASYASADSSDSRSSAVQTAMTALLSMRVPSSEKAIHLEFVLSLQQMKSGLQVNPQDVTEGFERLQEIVSQTSWLAL